MHISTRTKEWEVTVPTDQEEFVVLTPDAKKMVRKLMKSYGTFDNLRDAIDEGEITEVDKTQVRMVEEECKVNRPYLYVSSFDIFQTEADLLRMAKENGGEIF